MYKDSFKRKEVDLQAISRLNWFSSNLNKRNKNGDWNIYDKAFDFDRVT